jgi:hypothetical protein
MKTEADLSTRYNLLVDNVLRNVPEVLKELNACWDSENGTHSEDTDEQWDNYLTKMVKFFIMMDMTQVMTVPLNYLFDRFCAQGTITIGGQITGQKTSGGKGKGRNGTNMEVDQA